MFSVYCPYCHKNFSDDFMDFNLLSEETFQTECPHCGKVLNVTPVVTIDVYSAPCHCQLENHEFVLSDTHPTAFSHMVCKHCGTERPLTNEERIKYHIPTVDEYIESLNKEGSL